MTAPAAAHPKRESAAWTGLLLAVLLPLALVALLRLTPKIDERWENSGAHFWLVLATAAVATGLAAAISENGRRRRDARLLLIGLAFVVSAAFLGLHALATPGVILSGKNGGFTLATPIGLVLAGGFAAASAAEFGLETSLRIVRHARALQLAVAGIVVAWAIVSLAELRPLRSPLTPEELTGPLAFVAAAGVFLYAFSAVAYLRIYRRRGGALALAVACGVALLAGGVVGGLLSLETNWRPGWGGGDPP